MKQAMMRIVLGTVVFVSFFVTTLIVTYFLDVIVFGGHFNLSHVVSLALFGALTATVVAQWLVRWGESYVSEIEVTVIVLDVPDFEAGV